ncbi:MAG: hypothetical protein Fur0042_12570 [Cyanophyceae cyanobacterium]
MAWQSIYSRQLKANTNVPANEYRPIPGFSVQLVQPFIAVEITARSLDDSYKSSRGGIVYLHRLLKGKMGAYAQFPLTLEKSHILNLERSTKKLDIMVPYYLSGVEYKINALTED